MANTPRFVIIILSVILTQVSCDSIGSLKNTPEYNQIKSYVTRAESLVGINPEGALILCDSARAMITGNALSDSFSLSVANISADAFATMGMPDSAFSVERDIYLERQNRSDTTEVAMTLYRMGWFSNAMGQTELAERYTKEAVNLIERANIQKNRANILSFYAEILTDKGRYAESQECLYRAVRFSEMSKDTSALGLSYQGIGHIYGLCNNPGGSLEYYRKAYSAFSALKDYEHMVAALTNIGLTYRLQDEPDSALSYYHRALTIDKGAISTRNKVVTMFNIGNVYLDLKQYDKAGRYYKDVLKMCEENGIKQGLPKVYSGFGALEYALGNHEKAGDYYNKAVEIARELGDNSTSVQVMKASLPLYKETGKWEKWAELNEDIRILEDSLLSAEKKSQVMAIAQAYEIEQKEVENRLLNESLVKENRNSRLLLVLLLLFIMVSGVTTFMYLNNKKLKEGLESSSQVLMEQYREKKKAVNYTKESAPSTDGKSEELMSYFTLRKPYRDAELKVADIAEALGWSKSEVQATLKKLGFQNFNGLLNHFRVEEVVLMFENPEYRHYTVEAIAKECGFGSRASFYQIFLSVKGVNPAFYRSQIGTSDK